MAKDRFQRFTAFVAIASMVFLTTAASLFSPAAIGYAMAEEQQIVTDERAKMLKRIAPSMKNGLPDEPKTVTGPVYAIVGEVKDGDTISVIAYPWPGFVSATDIRAFGIDTPEKKRHLAGCDEEVPLGEKATALAKSLIKSGDIIQLRTIFYGKYAGRTVAEIWFQKDGEWQSLLEALMDEGLADAYFGGTKVKNWCD